MHFVFIVLALSGLYYFLFKERRFDGAALAFFSAVVYFAPGFTGQVPYASRGYWMDPMQPLLPETYAVMCAVLAALLVTTLAKDHITLPDYGRVELRGMEFLSTILVLMAFCGYFMTVETTGWETLSSPNKDQVLENINRWFTLWSIAASLAVVTAFVQRRWMHMFIAMALLGTIVYVGFRMELVMTGMALAIIALERRGPQRLLLRHWRWVAPLGLAVTFVLVFKIVSLGMKIDESEFITEHLLNPETYYFALVYSEPFYVQGTLNEVIANNFFVGLDHLGTLFMLAVPYAPELGLEPVSFNDLFQPALFPQAVGGLASNIWAEMWSSGGWLLLVCFLFAFVVLVHFADALFRRSSPELKALIALCIAYWGFYIHRNDLVFELVLVRNVLIVFLIAAAISKFISLLRPPVPSGAARGTS